MVKVRIERTNEMMNEARAIATQRMVEEAEAIVNISYTSFAIMQGMRK